MNKNYCPLCREVLLEKGAYLTSMWEIICDAYYASDKPIIVLYSRRYFTLIKYLELNGYVITTEFPDPILAGRDALIVEPQAYTIDSFTGKSILFCARACIHFDK